MKNGYRKGVQNQNFVTDNWQFNNTQVICLVFYKRVICLSGLCFTSPLIFPTWLRRLCGLISIQRNGCVQLENTAASCPLLALPVNIIFSHSLKHLDHKYQYTSWETFRIKRSSRKREIFKRKAVALKVKSNKNNRKFLVMALNCLQQSHTKQEYISQVFLLRTIDMKEKCSV